MVKLFIANRGEIACRIAFTAHRMGIRTCGIFTPQDARTKHVRVLQEIKKLPAGDLSENYLNQQLLIQIAKDFGADGLHPGYGFLAENPDFAQNVINAGLIWVGPPPQAMRRLGGKLEAKEVAAKAGVPVPPWINMGNEIDPKGIIDRFGLPLLIKATRGGGGRGQRVVHDPSQFEEALRAAKSEAHRSFGSSEVFVEKFLEEPRHIEVQILGDVHGNVFALGERDCTMQRRNQKIIEESPATILDDETRQNILEAARSLASSVGYTNAGTIEFLAQRNQKANWEFFFMELNARLQVEHPVTEMITGLDLVELQIRAADGENLKLRLHNLRTKGHALELRLCAENPANNFLPTPGPLTEMLFPDSGVRIDSGYEPGDVVPQEYDSLFAKLIVHGKSRDETIELASNALEKTLVAGTITNKFYLQSVLNHEDFRKNRGHTRWIESHPELLKEDGGELDEDLSFWGKKFSSDLLVQRINDAPAVKPPTRILTGFTPEEAHGGSSSIGVRVAGHFEIEEADRIYASGWVNRFELCVTFQRPVKGIGQRRLTFAGKYEVEDLRTHHGPITAQVPGVVLEVRAKAEDIVHAMQPILIVEAMKIEMPFALPIAARITEILVQPGDRIMPGQTLVTWEPSE
ncbi:ATP-grasp domain-containing protein [bacterium]|nr:ATP-grasp domain-containing protein [bacterium]